MEDFKNFSKTNYLHPPIILEKPLVEHAIIIAGTMLPTLFLPLIKYLLYYLYK